MGRLKSPPPLLGSPPPMLRVPPKQAMPFYQSPEWRKLIASIKRERGAFCCMCGSSHRVIGDHIVELKDGGEALDASNIQLLCHAHHQAKTAQTRARRARGQT